MGQVKIEIPRDTVIKRYLSYENFERLIKNQSLYFSRFDKFEDHLEGGINRRNYHNISNSVSVLDLAIQRWPGSSPRTVEESNTLESINTSILEETFPSILGHQKKIDGDAFIKRITSWLYASCWTDLRHECQAMWQLYGSSGSNCRHENGCQECANTLGKSVCIETTAGAVVDNLEIAEGYNLTINKIEYLDHRISQFHEDDLVMRPYFSKALHFSYENEVRFMLWPDSNKIKFSYKHNQSTINDQHYQQLRIKDLNSLIHRIILAPPPPSKISNARSLHLAHYDSELGLEENLSNKKLRAQIEKLFRTYSLAIRITESDLIQTATTDCYTLSK